MLCRNLLYLHFHVVILCLRRCNRAMSFIPFWGSARIISWDVFKVALSIMSAAGRSTASRPHRLVTFGAGCDPKLDDATCPSNPHSLSLLAQAFKLVPGAQLRDSESAEPSALHT